MDKKEIDISDKQALEARKQEMEDYILPGFMTKFTLPNSGNIVDIYSKSPDSIKIF